MQAQVKMLELSEHFEYKKCLHIFPNIHVQQIRIMIYNWLIMLSSEYK